MKKIFVLVFVALLVSVLGAGIKKTIYKQLDVIVFHPDSLVSMRADAIIWGNLWLIQSDSTDTMSMTPDKMTIDSITITDYLHCTDDVQFDSTLRFGSGAVISNPSAETLTITEGNINFVGKLRAGAFGSPLDVTSNRKYGAELHYYGNNYDVFGLRSRAQLKTTDAPTRTACGAEIQATNNDGINASVLNGAIIEAIGKSTTTGARIGTMRGLIVNTEWSAHDTITDLKILHLRTHTTNATDAGSFDGTGYGLYIENQAVGGNGQALDAGIYLDGTNLSAGNKAFTYGADFSGVATDIGTADFRFRSGGLIDNPVDTFRITEAKLDLIGDALLDDVTIDSALTVEGKAVFNDTVMLGDSADKMILPKGSAIELFDTTDTDKFQIYDTGTKSVFASVNPFTMNRSLWLLGDTLFFTDGGADTNWIVNTGVYLQFGGDLDFYFYNDFTTPANIYGNVDAREISWHGWKWKIDSDDDDALAYIYFHGVDKEAIKVDSAGQKLWWTGAGGIGITDAVGGADSARWYDDGSRTIFTSDNPFTLDNNVWIPGDTLYLTDGGADTNWLVNTGTYLEFGGDIVYDFIKDVVIDASLIFENNYHGGFIPEVDDGLHWYVYGGAETQQNRNIIICDFDYRESDFDHSTISTNPTLFVHSAKNPDTDNTEWISLTHDQTDGVIDVGSGAITLIDDVTLGDTINTVFLPKGTQLIFADSSGADSTVIHNDGVKLSIISDNRIEFGGNNIYLYTGDTLFFAEGENDAYLTLHGTDFEMQSDLGFRSVSNFEFDGNVDGNTDASYFYWDGYRWGIDSDNDDAIAMIIFHAEDSIKVDTSLHVMDWTGAGGIKADVIVTSVCDTVASAATITLGNYNNFVITGTANMDSIDTAGAFPNWGIAYIQFTGIASANGLTDGKNLKLAGNFAHNADDMIMLQRRGDIFYELSRSVN